MESGGLRVMFYNVENFFDPFDDSLTMDDEFTSAGSKAWTYSKFMVKAVKIARVIIAAGNPDPPAIIGLAEVENRFVLEKLVYETPLKAFGYRIVHKDSPDMRGIDVALLYRKELLRIDTSYYLPVKFPDTTHKTRDILIARCVFNSGDTLVVAVNHWPSRYGGAAASEPRRLVAAGVMRDHVDALCRQSPGINMLVMGDFNDEPRDRSLRLLAPDSTDEAYLGSARLHNLMPGRLQPNQEGTIKHAGVWSIFDQVLASGALYDGDNGMKLVKKEAAVLTAAFLLEADNSYLGRKPFRTFQGPAFHGGFSDHLPVYVVISIP